MKSISQSFKEKLKKDKRNYLLYADITLESGETLNLTNKHIWQNGFVIDDATSGNQSFDVGSVIIGSLSLTINNIYDDFSKYDFADAKVMAYVGLEISDGTVEKIPMGTYNVNKNPYNESVIILKCLDNIRLFDQPYSKSTLEYPATLLQIAQDACECCGLQLNTKRFDHCDYIVESRPSDEATTFREVMSWVAQIACKFVKCDAYGRVVFGWYDEPGYTETFALATDDEYRLRTSSGEDILIISEPSTAKGSVNGGYFDKDTPYSSGESLDGGQFNPWDQNTKYDGGTFDEMKTYHHIWSMNSLNVGTDDINITGVSVALENDEGDSTTYLYGESGYVISIEKNGLIQTEDNAKTAAVYIGEKLVGMNFRTFSCVHISDPSIEAGDTAYITDRKQNSYKTYITNTVFTPGDMQRSSCGAETPVKKNSTRFTQATKAIVEAKKNTKKQIDSYDKAVQSLTSMITQSLGAYKTEEKLDDGSTIFYMHNKPTVEESDTIWKMTADAFAVSTDGGKTWNAGMDSQGNVVLNLLSVIGIRSDWAKGGTLTLGGENNVSGVLKLLDKDGNVICTLNNLGADIIGKITSRNADNGFSTTIADGKLTMTDVNGNRVLQAYLAEEIDASSGSRHWYAVIQGSGGRKASIRLDGQNGEVDIETETFKLNGIEGKSGKAEFSDGSYLTFQNGVMTGGKTASGTTF